MMLVVTGVGFLIHVYSAGYMHDDPGYARFFTYLNLFVFSMVMLVLAGNFLLMYVFWEAVGLCSYLLIGFWYERKSAAAAGKKAFIVNRVGDFGFGLGMLLIWTTFGTLDYGAVFAKADASVRTLAAPYTAIALLLFLGAVRQARAAAAAHWLPDAMEGPTPVSALIHAATMVTAGVYMVARCHVLFEMAPVSLEVVAWVGGAHRALRRHASASCRPTSSACWRTRPSASSATCSWRVGVGAYAAGIFHLVTHAFFKALLFLGAGSVIHALHGEQDMRKMGGLKPKMLITTSPSWWGPWAGGIPPLAGFFSKDEILAAASSRATGCSSCILLAGAVHDRLLHVPARHPRLLRRRRG